ncbi:acyltransferase [Kitasatospora terrestris]|uniref:Transferase family protein n=1 Tax=Kitasatospora terrestris TaxID=258051 RepID=A0ABP9EBF0_9ACTN
MSAWPQFRGVRTVTAGRATGTVVRCGLTDTMLADLSVSVVHFYERALDEDRLASGLAAALAAVPEFGGRLRTADDGVLEIVCDDAGVPMAAYEVDGTLEELMGRVTAPGGGDLVDPVDAAKARGGGLPLFTVRVTRPSAGGTALGCSWHHAVGDLQSFMLLMRAWSAAVEGGTVEPAVQVVDREAYLERHLPATDCGRPGFRVPDAAEAAALAAEVAAAGRANRTLQVFFAEEEVARLHREAADAAGRRLSAGDALTAHVVATLRELDGDTGTRWVTVPVNVRRALGMPATLVGNPLSEIHLPWAPAQGPAALAGALRDAVLRFPEDHLNLRSNLDFLRALGRERTGECVPLGFDPANRRFSLSNWSRFGLYEVVFEGRPPVFFSPAGNFPVPWMSWMAEGFGGRGFLLTVVLPARLAARLRGGAGRAALHRHRRAEDGLPALARGLAKLL